MTSFCFFTSGDITMASARIRAFWVTEYLDEATTVHIMDGAPHDVPDVDVYVWQKRFDLELMKNLYAMGKYTVWDVCDPVWWFSPDHCRWIDDMANEVVANTEALADEYKKWSKREPIIIPDRIKLEHYRFQRSHRPADPVRLIWFGNHQNRIAIAACWPHLVRLHNNGHKIALTIFDDRPGLPLFLGDEIPVYFHRWSLDQEPEVLAEHDIAVLPPYPGVWGKLKSNNRTLTAAAAGLPVVDGLDYEELRWLVNSSDLRRHKGEQNYRWVQDWHVQKSALQWAEAFAHV